MIRIKDRILSCRWERSETSWEAKHELDKRSRYNVQILGILWRIPICERGDGHPQLASVSPWRVFHGIGFGGRPWHPDTWGDNHVIHRSSISIRSQADLGPDQLMLQYIEYSRSGSTVCLALSGYSSLYWWSVLPILVSNQLHLSGIYTPSQDS